MRKSVLLLMVALAPGIGSLTHAQQDAQYEADLNKRADGVLEALNLEDADKAARVKQAVIAQYRSIREIDAKFMGAVVLSDKAAVAKAKEHTAAAKKPLHDTFLETLAKDLSSEQVEIVKDQMTYKVVKITYDAYCDQIPQLSEAQKAYILAQLKDAREIAIDQGSSKDKHAVFGKAKGRINNYLAKQGYDLKKEQAQWQQRIKARQAAATQAAE
jgi:hypothetical protein